MKKLLFILIAVGLSISVFGCNGNDSTKPTSSTQSSSTSNEENISTDKVDSNDSNKKQKKLEEKKETPIQDLVSIELLGKQYHPIDVAKGQVQEFISLDFKIKNLSDKDIAGIKTSIKFLDAFGDEIITLNFKFDDTIASQNEYLTEGIGLGYNQFIDEHIKFKDADFSKMSIEYKIQQIVYTDEVETLKSNEANNEIDMRFTDMVFYPVDIMAGRASEFLELKLVAVNNTDKSISAFQGTTKFKDIFGDEIMYLNYSCDKTIAPKSQIEISGQGLDYNMFLDEHVRLKNTPFEKIIFEFIPKKILFEDGTILEK